MDPIPLSGFRKLVQFYQNRRGPAEHFTDNWVSFRVKKPEHGNTGLIYLTKSHDKIRSLAGAGFLPNILIEDIVVFNVSIFSRTSLASVETMLPFLSD